MRLAVLTLVCIINIFFASAYSIKNKKAIALYEEAQQVRSTEQKVSLLEDAMKKSPKFVEAYWQLADTQAKTGNINKAKTTLETAINANPDYKVGSGIRLAELLYNNGLYSEAYNEIVKYYDSSNRVPALMEKYRGAIDLVSQPIEFDIQNVINPEFNHGCYFPSITADGRTLSVTASLPTEFLPHDTLYQEDLFYIRLSDNRQNIPLPFSPVINSDDNEGSQSFSSDGRYMFFVKCNCRDNVGSCDIYYSIRHGNSWSIPENIGEPVNSRYWESNPCLSSSGNKLYFVSNRPGGEGDMDIWVADITIADNGTLTSHNARPLGKPINTTEAESAPFIHADNKTLYFLSNGHNGLGNNDIYISRMTDTGLWSTPENIGYPINNHGNQLGITVSGNGTTGYYASDIAPDGSRGKLRIYRFGVPPEYQPQAMHSIAGIVADSKTLKPLDAKIEIFNTADNSTCFKSVSDRETGMFSGTLPFDGNYEIIASKRGFMFNATRISAVSDTVYLTLTPIEKGEKVILDNIEFEYNSDKIVPETMSIIKRFVEFMTQNPRIKVTVSGHTDNIGGSEYNMDLSLRRAQSVINAIAAQGIEPDRLKAEGCGDTMPIADNTTEEGRKKNRRVEITIF